jgi:Asp-tRNA(Asn)/Glu-tRNA(Gln) amidotransferase B subunit
MASAQEKPEWLENWKPDPDAPKTGNPNWKPGMKSPNPKGRPRGIVDKRMRVAKLLEDDADKVVRVVIDSALKGDVSAASLVLSRIAPALKAQAEKVNFEFDASAPMTEQVQSVLQGIANGEVSPDVGKQIIESIATLAGIKQIDELEKRLAALEIR